MACDHLADEEEYQRLYNDRFNGLIDDGSVDDLKIQNDAKIADFIYDSDQKDEETLYAQLYKKNSQNIEGNSSEDDLQCNFYLEKTSGQDKESDTVSENGEQFELHTEEKSTAPEIKNAAETKDKIDLRECAFEESVDFVEQKYILDRRCLPDVSRHDKVSNSRVKHSTSTYIQMLLFVSLFIGHTEGHVDIFIPEPPLHLGSNISLTCVCNESGQSPTAWLQGQDRRQLANGNTSKDVNKYVASIHNENGVFEYKLTIQNFDMTDLDDYRCQFGFDRIKKTSLKRDFVIYLPDKYQVDIQMKHDSDGINITITIDRIYPLPEYCTINYAPEIISISNQLNATTQLQTAFYKVVLKTSMTILQECPRMFEVTCRIRTKVFILRKHKVKACAVKEKNTTQIVTAITVGSIVAVFISIVVVVLYKKRMLLQVCMENTDEINCHSTREGLLQTTINQIEK